MTLCLAMEYDKGVLLFSDSESVGRGYRFSGTKKVYDFGENILLSMSGKLRECKRLMLMMGDISTTLEHKIQEMSLEYPKNSRENLSSNLYKNNINITLRLNKSKKYEPEISLKEKRKKRFSDSLEIYSNGKGFNFLVESCGNFLVSVMEDLNLKDSHILIAGIDENGKKIYSADDDHVLGSRHYFATSGTASEIADTLFQSLYKENLTEKEALLLASYIGGMSEKLAVGVNKDFNASVIEENNGKIKRRYISQKKIRRLTRIADNLEPKFPFWRAK